MTPTSAIAAIAPAVAWVPVDALPDATAALGQPIMITAKSGSTWFGIGHRITMTKILVRSRGGDLVEVEHRMARVLLAAERREEQ